MRTAHTVEEQKSISVQPPKRVKGRGNHPNSRKNLVAPWRRGQSANPSGKPGYDVAAFLARKVIEKNIPEVYAGMAKALIGGNAYAFSVLADRGYGKLKEKVELSGDEALVNRLREGRKRLAEGSKKG
jgi:hypothetical protein